MRHFRITPLVAAVSVFLLPAMPAAAAGDEAPLTVAQATGATATDANPGPWPIAAPSRPFERTLSPEEIAAAQVADGGLKLPAAVELTRPPYSLWDRIRSGFAISDLNSPLVKKQIDWFASRPDFIKRTVERSSRYLYHIVEEVQKRGMPTEIALLPVIESAFNPVAYSRAHASGIWQFIPSTGKLYGLQQNFWYDGRRDVMAATSAALDYLEKLYDQFGSWDLALAAYNWGEGAVSRAIAKNSARGLPTDYQNLSMPAETRHYVPRLQAVKSIVANPAQYGITLDDIPNRPYFAAVTTDRTMDLQLAARLADTSLEEFKSLNPGHSLPVIRADGGQTLLVPLEKAETFRLNLENLRQPALSWQAYQLKPGDTLERLATRHNVTVAYLRQVNGITPKRKLGPGSTVLVPAAAATANLPDLPAPPVSVAQAPRKTVKQGRNTARQRAASQPQVVAHAAR